MDGDLKTSVSAKRFSFMIMLSYMLLSLFLSFIIWIKNLQAGCDETYSIITYECNIGELIFSFS